MNNSLNLVKYTLNRNYLTSRRVYSAVAREVSSSSTDDGKKQKKPSLTHLRFAYPEFLPDPKIEWRNKVRESIERQDMLKRRCQVEIPEFYVGSVLAVSTSDQHSPNKKNRFVGICILREFCGLNARFILRNVVDHQGIEVVYDLYDPTIQKVEVLRLEKRLDDRLLYLRDALPEYSTFDFNMDPEVLPENSPIPVNDTKVKLKPRPWSEKWERQNLQGVENIDELLYDKYKMLAKKLATPWEKYDLMKEYRRTIPEEEQNTIFSEVVQKLQELKTKSSRGKKRTFLKPKKLA